MTEFEAEALRRFDRVEALLAKLAGDVDGPLLREIARAFAGRNFAACEVTVAAEADRHLHSALERAVGLPSATRRLGKLLQRVAGTSIGGVLVCRVGHCNAGGLWTATTTLVLSHRVQAAQDQVRQQGSIKQ